MFVVGKNEGGGGRPPPTYPERMYVIYKRCKLKVHLHIIIVLETIKMYMVF